MSEVELVKTDCWCYATQRQVQIIGAKAGKRQADLLQVTDCVSTIKGNERKRTKDCPKRFAVDCLIGKTREGRW